MSLDLPSGALPAEIGASLEGYSADWAARATASLALGAADLLRADQTGAWSSSGLTGDGFPVELTVTTADTVLRWTLDPATPDLAPGARLEAALTALVRLGHPLEPGAADVARRVGAGAADGFGGWIGGRHDQNGDRYKLYADLADGPGAEWALAALDLARPRLPSGPARGRMLGFGPGQSTEVYFNTRATRACLPRLLDPAGLPDMARPLGDAIQAAWGHPIRDRLPGGSVGVSYARLPGRADPMVTLYLFARSLWGGDGRIRRNMMARLAAAGAPSAPYDLASLSVAEGQSAQTRHGLVGITVTGGRLHWSVGLRPAAGPC